MMSNMLLLLLPELLTTACRGSHYVPGVYVLLPLFEAFVAYVAKIPPGVLLLIDWQATLMEDQNRYLQEHSRSK